MADEERISRQVDFRAQAGKGDELAGLLLEAAAGLEGVDGCELYLIARDPADPELVRVVEVWTSAAAAADALDAGSDEVQAVMALLDGSPQMTEGAVQGGLGPRTLQAPSQRRGYTLRHLLDAEDLAPRFGLSEMGETRVPRKEIGAERTGLSHYRQKPGRQPFGHQHRFAEEVYVVLAGNGRVKLDDDVVELAPLDVLRVAPATIRQFEAGPEGMEYLAFGPHAEGEAEMLPGWWAD
jgi:quinol monooxygenase YgiN/mannose-6-phosphate isomerase-like protein (cupin superfamily)